MTRAEMKAKLEACFYADCVMRTDECIEYILNLFAKVEVDARRKALEDAAKECDDEAHRQRGTMGTAQAGCCRGAWRIRALAGAKS